MARVAAIVTIDDSRAPEAILAALMFNIGSFLAPELPRQPLDVLIARGLPTDAIFNGPLLRHGFIDDAALQPKATAIAFLINPDTPRAEFQVQQVQGSARSLGLRLEIVRVRAESELEGAFATLARQGVGALLVGVDQSMHGWAEQMAVLALRHALPTIFGDRVYVVAGGLMSYDSSLTDSYRQVGVYVGRILKGEKPADLPVMQPTRFEFVLNLKTAKALGLEIPPTLLARADEVIE